MRATFWSPAQQFGYVGRGVRASRQLSVEVNISDQLAYGHAWAPGIGCRYPLIINDPLRQWLRVRSQFFSVTYSCKGLVEMRPGAPKLNLIEVPALNRMREQRGKRREFWDARDGNPTICETTDPELWFPNNPWGTKKALEMCGACPLLELCHESQDWVRSGVTAATVRHEDVWLYPEWHPLLPEAPDTSIVVA